MELATRDVAALDRRGDAIVAVPRVGEAILLARGHHRERVHEIRAAFYRQALEDGVFPGRPPLRHGEAVPADVRDLHGRAVRILARDARDLAGQYAQAIVRAELL